MGFLRQVKEVLEHNLGVDTWKMEGEERVLQATGTKPLQEYIERRQAIVADWVALLPVFNVCAKETEFEVRRRVQEQWWSQTVVEKQVKTTINYILAVARERCHWKFGRFGEGERGSEDSDTGDDGS